MLHLISLDKEDLITEQNYSFWAKWTWLCYTCCLQAERTLSRKFCASEDAVSSNWK